jgi:rod shape-determining protein MreC
MVAPLCWDGSGTDRAVLKNIPLHLDVPVGDTVLTSGISAIYPADIPVGVTEGVRLVDGAVGVVDVKLFVDFAALRYVIIAENPDRAFIQKMEE